MILEFLALLAVLTGAAALLSYGAEAQAGPMARGYSFSSMAWSSGARSIWAWERWGMDRLHGNGVSRC